MAVTSIADSKTIEWPPTTAASGIMNKMQRPRTHFTTVDGLSIAYQVIGEGPLDLVFAHGWVSNIEYAWESPHFARFLRNLSRFCRLIFFDRRGTGLSDREIGAPSVEQRTEDISAVMDAVGSHSAAVMGVSEGGNMAAAFAAMYPERIDALILYGSSAKGSWAPDYPWGMKEEDLDAHIEELRANWGQPFEMDLAAPSMVNDMAAREWFAAYLRHSVTRSSMEKITRLNAKIDMREILPTIHVPTLVMIREHDRWAAVEESRYIASLIPHAACKVLPGEDHLPWYGDQDGLVAEVEEFLTGKRDLPTGEQVLLSVLITDIVGSTEKAAALGDSQWRALLDQHHQIVRRRVSAFGGEIANATGDGFVVTFSGPSRAIACLQAVQADLRRHGLSIRAGLHTGECQRHGAEIGGLAVHIAARLLDEAAEDELVVSSTVRDLTFGSNIAMDAMGTRTLKGVPGNWALYRVAASSRENCRWKPTSPDRHSAPR
jgi:pimeloyl-ACP methyl ester carboxylesterase/class 3 adenylate cyclase